MTNYTEIPTIIKGGHHTDERGTISFINDFDMSDVKRMYTIAHPATSIIRAWQGHKIEAKYFKCIKGKFLIALVKIDDWTHPSKGLVPMTFILDAAKSEILYVPEGYANGFIALEENAALEVFSNKDMETAKNDQYRYDENLWLDWKGLIEKSLL